ncbi:unnamed protein product [Larinioides sclopetarius]|uniref:Uncharacterized protein n=1 Tax=Larinioides sclopetarius TaxID=280406 RepID=A0AAV1YXH5_9ARAC
MLMQKLIGKQQHFIHQH